MPHFFSPLFSSLKAISWRRLQPGDIAFILFDADSGEAEGPDQFAFVALNAIAAGEEIYFRDDEWVGDAFAGTATGAISEDELLWTAPAGGVTAGTVVVIGDGGGTGPTTSVGTIAQTIGDGTGLGLSGSGDEVWAFLGTSNTPSTFLAAISSSGFDGVSNTLDGTNLIVDSAFAIELQNNVDHAFYSGPREGFPLLADYPILLEEPNKNWTQESPTGINLIADTTPFVTGGTPVVFLTLSFDPESFLENAGPDASTGTVTLSATRDIDTMVELASDDLSEATVPAMVTIPANTLAATFPIDAVDDGLADGDRLVQIAACATDIAGDESPVTVTDDGDAPTTVLATGDVLFICFNADNNSFGFVAINDLPAGEIIFFTDEEWNGSEFGGGESDIIWTAPAEGLNAGEVVIFTGTDVAETTVTGGGTITKNGNSGLSTSTETIYAYQGPAARQPVTFLAAISNTSGASIANTGLTADVDALFLDNATDAAQFVAPRSGQATIAAYAPLIADLAANWNIVVGGENETTLCDETDFVTEAPTIIEIVACGFLGNDFFIEIATTAAGLKVTSAPTLDFSAAEDVNTIVFPGNPNRFVISAADRGALSDFFRVEPQ